MITQPARRARRHLVVLVLVLAGALALVALGPPAALAAGWEVQRNGVDQQMEQVFAVGADEAWVFADSPNGLFHTTDGGASWPDANNTGLAGDYEAAFFLDSDHGWVVDHNYGNGTSNVAYTTDGGSSWDQSTMDCQAKQISFADAKNGWMGGMNPRGKILHSSDGGATWDDQTYGDTSVDSVSGVAAIDADTCWALVGTMAGAEAILTTDGGKNWNTFAIAVPDKMFVDAIVATDADHAWVAGGNNIGRVIMATSDGGDNWTVQYESPAGNYFQSIDVLPDGQHGWAVDGDAQVFATTDGGAHWAGEIADAGDVLLYGIDFCDANNGWACGDDGTIIHTSDGGGPFDTTAPTTTPSPADGTWVNASNAKVRLTADDGDGAGVWKVKYEIDGAVDWTWMWPGNSLDVPYDAVGHTLDGPHTVDFAAVDKVGNTEATQSLTINVDTVAPTASGLRAIKVKRHKYATVRYNVADSGLCAGLTSASIAIAKKNKFPAYMAGTAFKPAGTNQKWRFKCNLKKGTYYIYLQGHDLAGNSAAKELKKKFVVT